MMAAVTCQHCREDRQTSAGFLHESSHFARRCNMWDRPGDCNKFGVEDTYLSDSSPDCAAPMYCWHRTRQREMRIIVHAKDIAKEISMLALLQFFENGGITPGGRFGLAYTFAKVKTFIESFLLLTILNEAQRWSIIKIRSLFRTREEFNRTYWRLGIAMTKVIFGMPLAAMSLVKQPVACHHNRQLAQHKMPHLKPCRRCGPSNLLGQRYRQTRSSRAQKGHQNMSLMPHWRHRRCAQCIGGRNTCAQMRAAFQISFACIYRLRDLNQLSYRAIISSLPWGRQKTVQRLNYEFSQGAKDRPTPYWRSTGR